jgi:hypothetical protein
LNSAEFRWVVSTPLRGDGGFNAPRNWHLDPASIHFAEVTIEACQSTPQFLEDNLDYWIDFNQVCIWAMVDKRER